MSFGHLLVSSSILAGGLFTAATLPLSNASSDAVEVTYNGEPVFVGTMQDMAVPYVGAAAVVGLGVGFTTLAMGSWQQTTKKLKASEAEVARLKRELTAKVATLEKLKFSDSQLNTFGLEGFLGDAPRPELHAETRPEPVAAAPTLAVAAPIEHSVAPGPRAATPRLQREPESHLNHVLEELQRVTAQVQRLQAQHEAA